MVKRYIMAGLVGTLTRDRQDEYLTANPRITFHKQLYEQYEHFSLETIQLDVRDGSSHDGQNIKIISIPNNRFDILRTIYLSFSYNPEYIRSFDCLAEQIIKYAIFRIGDQSYEMPRDFISTINRLSKDQTQREKYINMINGDGCEEVILQFPHFFGLDFIPVSILYEERIQLELYLDNPYIDTIHIIGATAYAEVVYLNNVEKQAYLDETAIIHYEDDANILQGNPTLLLESVKSFEKKITKQERLVKLKFNQNGQDAIKELIWMYRDDNRLFEPDRMIQCTKSISITHKETQTFSPAFIMNLQNNHHIGYAKNVCTYPYCTDVSKPSGYSCVPVEITHELSGQFENITIVTYQINFTTLHIYKGKLYTIEQFNKLINDLKQLEQPEQANQPEQTNQPKQADQPEQATQPEQANQPEQTNQPKQADQSEKAVNTDQFKQI